MLSVPCGVLPLPPPLVQQCPSSAVTGETGCSLASPQKSGELNKPPGKHKISFTLCSWATPKEVLLPPPKKEQEVVSQSRSGSLQIFPSSSSTIFYSFTFIAVLLFSRLLSCSASAYCKRLVFIARLSAVMALCSLLAPSVSFSCCSAICVTATGKSPHQSPNPPLIQFFNYIMVIY